jgi:hypothetical protein
MADTNDKKEKHFFFSKIMIIVLIREILVRHDKKTKYSCSKKQIPSRGAKKKARDIPA